jgi:dTDP-4-dehydrorhamnose reductase
MEEDNKGKKNKDDKDNRENKENTIETGKMKILVTGARGMLGSAVMAYARGVCGVSAVGSDLSDFDICDASAAAGFIDQLMPDALIHCAAFTNVDAAESDSEKAFCVNAMAVRDLAVICAARGIKLAVISTDYVFDGSKESPYGEYDLPSPINVYGMSKYYAERYCGHICSKSFIVRTSWLFGANGVNFVGAILKKAADEGELSVVNDQFGSPTYTKDLAAFLIELVKTEKYGIYHATNDGYCSWHDFASEILKVAGLSSVKLYSVSSENFKRPAARPKNSRLLKTALCCSGFKKLRAWQEALAEYINEICLVPGYNNKQ